MPDGRLKCGLPVPIGYLLVLCCLTEHLTSELVQTAQLQATALQQLIGFGILASESDVDFFLTQVEPNVNSAIKKLREREQELTAQVQSAASRTATAQQQLANTTDPVSKQALTNLIARLQGQQSNLEALQAQNEKAADELEDLLKQANDSLTPLRQKQELEIRQKLDSNDERLQALQSQLNSENAAENAINADTVLAYAQLNDQIRQDLTLNASNWTQQLLDGNLMTKELGTSQQNLSAAVDDLIAYINDNFADPHGEYNRSEADLRDGITTLGVLENRADELDSAFTSTEDAIERIKLRIAQDAALWDEIAPIAIRYGAESQELQAYQQQYQAILAAKAPQLAQAQTLLTNAEAVQKQANAQSNLAQILSQQIAALKNTLPSKLRNVTQTSVLSKLSYSFYGGVVNQINSLQQQLQAAQNQSAAFAQQAASLRQQANALKQQASQSVDAEVKVLRSTFLEEHPDNGTAIDLLQAATLEGSNPNQQISQQLNAPNADTLLNAPAVEGRNPLQALFDKSKAAQASHEAQGYALLAQAAWYEQQAAYHWNVSRKNGPYWYEQRWVKGRSGKGHWETVTHVDHNWIVWQQYSQLFPQLRQQGYAHLVEADKWRKEKERLEPLKNQWIESNDAANEANPVVKEARNFFAELEAARSDIPQAKTQQELLETLLPTLKQQLEEAEAEAAAQNAKVQQQWEDYDTDSEEYRAAVADILQRRGELNKQSIETQQQLAESERWVEQQTVALSAELSGTKMLIDALQKQRQNLAAEMLNLVNQDVLVDDLDDFYTKDSLLEQSLQMLTNKAAVLTSQQTALTQKRTLLTAQNEVILAEQRLLDAYINDPDADTSNLERQLLDARAALAEAQRLAEQAEAASKALTAPLQDIKNDLLAQNDEHLKAAKEHQQILRALVEATQSNANYTLQAAQKQQEVNNLEFQILQRLQQATAAGYQQAKHLLDVAQYNDMATAAELYYRDYKDLASDKGNSCAPGLARPEDRILADQYYREMLNQRELQRRAQAQADAFRVAKETAESQMNVLQQQQATAQQLLDELNAKVAETQEQREQKQQELAVAQARLDGITRIREQTEQTFIQLITLEKLNLAQAQLEQEIAQNRQADIDEAVAARQERDQLELERKRLETQARIEQLRQLQAEDDVRQNLNQVRSQLGLATLDATDDPVQLQTQLAGLLTNLQDLQTQQPDLPENVKTLLAEAQGDIHLALQGKEAANIQQNLLNAMDGLVAQIDSYKSEINRLDLEEQWDNQLLQTAQSDLQGASQQLLKELDRAAALSGEHDVIDPLYMEMLNKVALADQAVEISQEMAEQSKEILDQIIKQRIAERKARKKAFWNKILGIVSQVAGILSTVLMILSPAFPALIPFSIGLGAVSGAISTIQAAINGDWMGAIFSGIMTGLTAVTGGMTQALGESAKAVVMMKTLQAVASGAFNGARSLMSGDSIMGFLQILGSVAAAASAGMNSFINQCSGTLQKVMLSVVQSLQQAPQMIYSGIKSIQSGDWLNAIGNFFKGAMAIGQSFAGNFNTAVAGILDNISKVGNTALYLGNAIKDGGIEGWLSGLNGILGLWQNDLMGMVDKISGKEECCVPCPEVCDPVDEENLDEYNLQLDEEQAETIAENIQDLSVDEKIAFLEGFSLEDKRLILSNLSVEDQSQVILQLSIQQNGNSDENVEKWLSNLPKSDLSGVPGSQDGSVSLSGGVFLFNHKNEEYLAKMVYENPLTFGETIENRFGSSSGEKTYNYQLVDEIGVFDPSSQGGLQAFLFKREDGVPIVVFRGTEPKEMGDVLTDVDANGVGYSQFYNSNNFERLNEWAKNYPNAIVTGHSLGGALAQRYGINFPESVQEVVTFNAAGISPSEVNKFKQNGGGSFSTTHYVVEGDAVSLAGQFIPGDAYLMSFTSTYDFWNKHNKIFLEGGLLNNPNVRANPLPVNVLNSPNFHYSNPGYVAVRKGLLLSDYPLLQSIGIALTNRASVETTRSLIGNIINLLPGQK